PGQRHDRHHGQRDLRPGRRLGPNSDPRVRRRRAPRTTVAADPPPTGATLMSRSSATSTTAGDEAAFGELVQRHRRELHLHCYRMTGSFDEAEDLVQETFLRAWR